MIATRPAALAAVAANLLLAGCGGAPPPPPTVVNATLTTAPDVNADSAGTGSPVAIRIYQLGSSVGFKAATFFPLFERDAATLKDDLVARDDLLLGPGQTRTLTILPKDRTHAIGIFAAYRDYEHVEWRQAADVPAHETSTVTVNAGRAGLTVTIAPAKAAK